MTMTIYYSNKVFNKPQSEMPLDTPPVLFLERLPARGICGVSRNLRSTGSKPPASIKIHQVLSLKGKNELNSLTTSRPGKDSVLQFCSFAAVLPQNGSSMQHIMDHHGTLYSFFPSTLPNHRCIAMAKYSSACTVGTGSPSTSSAEPSVV